jgi:signal transduction histidine kinase
MNKLAFIVQSGSRGQRIRIEIKVPDYKVLKRIIIIISFAFSICNCFAQNIYRDSIRKKLDAAKDDTSKVLLLSRLGYYWRYTNMDSAIYYAEPALLMAKQLKYARGESIALSNLATTLREKGDLPRSLELQLDALQIAEKNNYLREEGSSFRRMGLVYMDLSDSRKTVDFCRKAIHNHQQIGNNYELGQDYLVTSQAFIDLKDSDSAWYFIQKAGEKIDYIKDLEPEFHLWRGNIYWLKRNKDSALADWREGFRLALGMEYYRSVSYIFYKMGAMYRQLNQPDSSIFYARKALEYAKMASHEKTVFLSSRLLFELYDSLSNPAEALFYSKIASAAKDSLFGAGNIQTIQQLIAHENARQTEIQAARASYQSRLRQIMLATGMGALLIIAAILYRNNRKKQKTNIILANQKAEIQGTLTQLKATQSQLVQAEKMASLGELTAGIAHEIQNPLNFVNNFSEVNAELLIEMREQLEKGNLAEAKRISADVEANEHKISHHGGRADGIVKNMVLHARGSVGQKEPTNINALAEEYLRLSYHAIRAKDKLFHAELRTAFDDTMGKIEIIPQDIGRVLVNMYNNAFYTVAEKRKQTNDHYEPIITVCTKKSNEHVEILVKDNGTGIPKKVQVKIFQPFFTTKPAGDGTGLGLSLAYDIIKAHGGDIKVNTNENEGTEFLIQLPLHKES